MTHIGEPQRIRRNVPIPFPAPKVKPIREPEKVPVRTLPKKEPEPLKKYFDGTNLLVTEIPYACPKCGRELTMENGLLYCPEHGLIYEL